MSLLWGYRHLCIIIEAIKLGHGRKLRLLENMGDGNQHGWFLQVYRETDPPRDGGRPNDRAERKWFISMDNTESEVVLTALRAYLTVLEDEAREEFRYGGMRVFDPHIDIHKLRELMDVDMIGQEQRTVVLED